MEIAAYMVVMVVSYFLGSLPAGYLAGKARGIDVRSSGSGNIGATNAFRVLGKKAGAMVLIIDIAKGFIAVRWVPLLALVLFPGVKPQQDCLALAAGAAAVLGHNYTCWLRFKGGKGIATSAGVIVAWATWPCLVALGLWALVFLITRFVSLASIAAAVALPFAAWIFHKSTTTILVIALLSVLAIYKHKANIQRLIAGTESRVGARKN